MFFLVAALLALTEPNEDFVVLDTEEEEILIPKQEIRFDDEDPLEDSFED